MQGFQRTAVWCLGIASAIGLLLYLFVFDIWTFPQGDRQFSASVLPTLKPEDVVLVRRGGPPGYGELARCASPLAPGTFIVGRVFGIPGDHVEVTDNVITTSGRALASRHGCPQMIVAHPVTENLVTMTCNAAETGAWSFEYLTGPDQNGGTGAATVDAGKLYLVSDNRLMHQDSRDVGLVDASTCEHVVFRLWGEKFTDGSRRFTILW